MKKLLFSLSAAAACIAALTISAFADIPSVPRPDESGNEMLWIGAVAVAIAVIAVVVLAVRAKSRRTK